MTQTRREALLLRRKSLQTRLKRERQRASIESVLSALAAFGVDYEVLWPDVSPDSHAGWITQHFPIAQPGRIDWGRVPGAECWPCRTYEECVALFSQVLGIYASAEHTDVIVIWSDANKPGLRISASAAVAIADELLCADFDTWVYAPEGRWLIECYERTELCAGHAP